MFDEPPFWRAFFPPLYRYRLIWLFASSLFFCPFPPPGFPDLFFDSRAIAVFYPPRVASPDLNMFMSAGRDVFSFFCAPEPLSFFDHNPLNVFFPEPTLLDPSTRPPRLLL